MFDAFFHTIVCSLLAAPLLSASDSATASLASLEHLCADLGLVHLFDARLCAAVQRLTAGREADAWHCLPELLGATLAAEEFHGAQAQLRSRVGMVV